MTTESVTVSFGGDEVFSFREADGAALLDVRYVALSTMSTPATFHGLDVDVLHGEVEGTPGAEVDVDPRADVDPQVEGTAGAAAAAVSAAAAAAAEAEAGGGKRVVSVRNESSSSGVSGSAASSATAETAALPSREYLEREILPHLQPAFEDLLRLVEQREKDKEAGFEINETFHPLHWLASYLMRKAPIAGAKPPAIAAER